MFVLIVILLVCQDVLLVEGKDLYICMINNQIKNVKNAKVKGLKIIAQHAMVRVLFLKFVNNKYISKKV